MYMNFIFTRMGNRETNKKKEKEVEMTGSHVCGQSSGLSEAEFLY